MASSVDGLAGAAAVGLLAAAAASGSCGANERPLAPRSERRARFSLASEIA
jgi:hypothetical protein